MKTNDYYLIKKDTSERIMFPAREVDGYLVSPQGNAMVVSEDVTEVGFKTVDFQKPFEQLTDAQREIVLRVGDNRGHQVEKRETPDERRAREKAERDEQNAFPAAERVSLGEAVLLCFRRDRRHGDALVPHRPRR